MPNIVYKIARHICPGYPFMKRNLRFSRPFHRILLFVFSLVFFANVPAEATHLIGGSITYTYLGTTRGTNLHRYLVKVDMFRDCSIYHLPQGQTQPTPFDPTIDVGVYERTGDTALYTDISIIWDLTYLSTLPIRDAVARQGILTWIVFVFTKGYIPQK